MIVSAGKPGLCTIHSVQVKSLKTKIQYNMCNINQVKQTKAAGDQDTPSYISIKSHTVG